MARSISDIYNGIQEQRANIQGLSSADNSSQMSIIDSIAYINAVAIYTFETILDVFTVDIAKQVNRHITGTKQYYINMLLKYQSGDILKVNDEGTSFGYDTEDDSKKIITIVSATEEEVDGYFDKHLVLKVATGEAGNYSKIDSDELESINDYMGQIAFAGTNYDVVSYDGDILVPKITVVYDNSSSMQTVKDSVVSALDDYVKNLSFSGKCYPNRILESLLKIDGVVDVISDNDNHTIGIYTVQRKKDGSLETDENGEPLLRRRIEGFDTVSGYLRQSSGSDEEENIPDWENSIIFKVDL